MTLNLSEDVAAFGLFHLAFAMVDDEVSKSLVTFLRSPNEDLALEIVGTMPLERRLRVLKALLASVKSEGPEKCALQKAMANIEEVRKWRNDRAHARAKIDIQAANVMLLGKNGRQIDIKAAICEDMIRKAEQAASTLKTHIPQFVDRQEVKALILQELLEAGW